MKELHIITTNGVQFLACLPLLYIGIIEFIDAFDWVKI
jgi:hypothetical protein